jgi:hypothetical protein
MRQGDPVVVDIHHGRVQDGPASDLMHVVHRRQAAAHVQELVHAFLSAVAHGPADEAAVLAGNPGAHRERRKQPFR